MRTPLEHLGAWLSRRVSGTSSPDVSLGTRLAGEDLTRDIIKIFRGGTPTRYISPPTNTDLVVKNSPGYLHAIILDQSYSAWTFITIKNSTQEVGRLSIPNSAQWTRYELGFWMDTDIRITVNNPDLRFTVIWS